MTPASSGAERRTERVSSSLIGRLLRRDGSSDIAISDINLHGMYIVTNETASIGSLLRLEVRVDEGEPIKMFVRVCHTKRTVTGDGFGAEIYLLGPEEHLRWMRYYRHLIDARY
jgi:hypothetical protein